MFYRDWGSGKPLLFLSGWTLNSQMWAHQMTPLSEQGFRCVAYDRRAHGRSSDPGRGYDFDTLADDLAAVIEALDLDEVTLIAHSFASGEVVRYLSRHASERVAGVVLVAAAAIPFLLKTHDNPTGVGEAVFDHLRALLTEDFPGWAEANAEPYFAGTASRAMIHATTQMMKSDIAPGNARYVRIQTTTVCCRPANMADLRRSRLSHVDAASAPVDCSHRLAMLFEYGNATPNQTVIILGAATCPCVCGWRSL